MPAPRLHLDEPLSAGALLGLDDHQGRYLSQVMRLRPGDAVRLFNARDGEWAAVLHAAGKRGVTVMVGQPLREPVVLPGPTLALAPMRPSRLDWVIEKAVELGVGAIVPVLTERTIVRPDRADRLRSIAREAAEQCERMDVPDLAEPLPLPRWLAERDQAQPLLLADEAGGAPAAELLLAEGPLPALLVGPEGGFTPLERRAILAMGGRSLTLGPTILRAETAGLALLAAWRVLRPA